jgi:predicted ferric reductase
MDLVYPVHSPSQPLENTVGAIAVYMVVFVVGTSYLRVRLGRHLWKAFHFTIYFAAVAIFWHSLFTDPDLKKSPVAWLDGGKIFIETCAIMILVMSTLRWRYSLRKAKRLSRYVGDPAPGGSGD